MIEYTFARFEAELARSMNRQSSETAATRRQLQRIEAEIRNCTHAIASEGLSSFLQTHLASEMAELETQHRDLTEKLVASEPRAMKLRLRDDDKLRAPAGENAPACCGPAAGARL